LCSKVEVNEGVVERARVLEDDRPDRRGAAPFAKILILLARGAERIERALPARIGAAAKIEGRERPRLRRRAGVLRIEDRLQRLGAEDFERAGDGLSEGVVIEAEPFLGAVEHLAEDLDLRDQLNDEAPRTAASTSLSQRTSRRFPCASSSRHESRTRVWSAGSGRSVTASTRY